MKEKPQSIYDFPFGYPNFESIKTAALWILRRGEYLQPSTFVDSIPKIDVLKLRAPLGKREYSSQFYTKETQYFFPICEGVKEGIMDVEEVKSEIVACLNGKARESIKFAYILSAEQIPGQFFLAWGLMNNIFTSQELEKVQYNFLHQIGLSEGGGSLFHNQEAFINTHNGGMNTASILDWIVNGLTNPSIIENSINNGNGSIDYLREQVQNKISKIKNPSIYK